MTFSATHHVVAPQGAEKPIFSTLLKVPVSPVELTNMEQVRSGDYNGQRAAFRVPMVGNATADLLLTLNGVQIDPKVEDLSATGACLSSDGHFDVFRVGQILADAVLVLPGIGMPPVCPQVRWTNYPHVGVEFLQLHDRDRQLIYKFLFNVEQQLVRADRSRDVRSRVH